jgi:archaellum component FlaF (FlaF/FlaG flagellin family)
MTINEFTEISKAVFDMGAGSLMLVISLILLGILYSSWLEDIKHHAVEEYKKTINKE